MSSTYEKISKLKKRLQKSPPVTIKELAVYMKCNQRTIFRYFKILESESSELKKTMVQNELRYYIDPEKDQTRDSLILSLEKMNAELIQSAHFRYAKTIRKAVQTLKGKNETILFEMPALDPDFIIDRGPFAEFDLSEPRIEKYLLAIKKHQCLSILYEHGHNNEISKIIIEPLKLILRMETLYLAYRKHSPNSPGFVQLLVFKRIKQESTLNQFFDEADFDETQFYKYCYGKWVYPTPDAKPLKIKLKILSPWLERQFLESNFNPPAKIKQMDQSTQVELNLFHTPDLERWLLSLYPDAYVVEPPSLKMSIKKLLKKSLLLSS